MVSLLFALAPKVLCAEPVTVRYREGTSHGFLVLRDLSGKALAAGDLTEVMHGSNIVTRLVFQFKDGSVDDETTVFSQSGKLRLLSDHHIQKGPAYPSPLDVLIQATTGRVTTRYEEKGRQQLDVEKMRLPPDLSNGLILFVLKNMRPETDQIKVHYLASLPKPRVVEIAITVKDDETFDVANVAHKATLFLAKVDLGGVAGIVAPLIGKQPADYRLWMVRGEAPAFIRMEGQLYNGGPIWSLEMSSPVWPKARPIDP